MTSEGEVVDPRALPISDPNETLLRQVHPVHLDKLTGEVQSPAFSPSSLDGLISTLRERVGPEEAHRRHEAQGLQSAGTWGVSVSEVAEAGAAAFDDAEVPGYPEDHASIAPPDGNGELRRCKKALAARATDRGALFLADRAAS